MINVKKKKISILLQLLGTIASYSLLLTFTSKYRATQRYTDELCFFRPSPFSAVVRAETAGKWEELYDAFIVTASVQSYTIDEPMKISYSFVDEINTFGFLFFLSSVRSFAVVSIVTNQNTFRSILLIII